MYRTLMSVALLMLLQISVADTQDAYSIMTKLDQRYIGDNSKSSATLVLIDQKDRQRARNLDTNRINEASAERTLIFFQSPSDVKGTAYMTFDWEKAEKEDDTWLYLPALQKIVRVAASNESGSFMGSDFSYADINGLDLEDFNYEIVDDSDVVDGHDCWVIRQVPKDKSVVTKIGYTEAIAWIRKDIHMMIKGIFHVKKAKKIKYYSARDIENINGVWTALTQQMVTTKNGKKQHSSVYKINTITYNTEVNQSMFSTQVMQRGF